MLEYKYLIESLKEYYPLLHDALTKKTGIVLMISSDDNKVLSYDILNVADIQCHEFRDYLSGFAITCNYDMNAECFVPSFQIKLNRQYKYTYYRLFLKIEELYEFFIKYIIDNLDLFSISKNIMVLKDALPYVSEGTIKDALSIIRKDVIQLYGINIEKFNCIEHELDRVKRVDDFNDTYSNIRSELYTIYKEFGYNYYEDF